MEGSGTYVYKLTVDQRTLTGIPGLYNALKVNADYEPLSLQNGIPAPCPSRKNLAKRERKIKDFFKSGIWDDSAFVEEAPAQRYSIKCEHTHCVRVLLQLSKAMNRKANNSMVFPLHYSQGR